MAEKGALLVHSFVSRAQIPVSNAMVIVSTPNNDGRHTLLWTALTDENGNAGPVELDAPNRSESLTPGNGFDSFRNYSLLVEHPDYQIALFQDLQVFSGIETIQDVPLIPLSSNGQNESDITVVTPQPL